MTVLEPTADIWVKGSSPVGRRIEEHPWEERFGAYFYENLAPWTKPGQPYRTGFFKAGDKIRIGGRDFLMHIAETVWPIEEHGRIVHKKGEPCSFWQELGQVYYDKNLKMLDGSSRSVVSMTLKPEPIIREKPKANKDTLPAPYKIGVIERD